PARALAGREARRAGAPSGRHPRRLRPDRRPNRPAAGDVGGERLRPGSDGRDPPTHVARGGPVRASRPPHGRPHRLSHRGAPPGDGLSAPVDLLDLLIILFAVSAIIGGYRLGFLGRAASWIGLGIGLVVAVHFLPDVVDALRDSPASDQLLLVAATLIAAGVVGP